MTKIFALTTSIFLAAIFSACSGLNNKPSASSASPLWTAEDLRVLESLSLYNFTPKHDSSNRVVDNKDAVALGKALFFDTRFSSNNSVSCASCHKPEHYFTDGAAQATGFSTTRRNTPTIVGASNNTWFFLDGRVDSLWSQALHPIEDSLEHRSSRGQFAKVIFNDSKLRSQYEKIFGAMPDISDNSRFPEHAGPSRVKSFNNNWKGMSPADQDTITEIFVNGGKAIAAYETQLQPSISRFDQYVKAISSGKLSEAQDILSVDEVAGLKVFLGKGNCFICHNGPLFTDNEFHNIATPPLDVTRYDFGRSKAVSRVKKSPFNCLSRFNDSSDKSCSELKYMVIHDEETRAAFKTPGLRNVTKTAPYMHAGQYKTLSEVIKHYNKPPPTKVGMSNLLDIDLNDKEMKQLEAFLHSLDSQISGL